MIKEILIYVMVGISSLLLMTFVVHMLVGGMVSPETEATIQEIVVGVLLLVFALAAWDIVRRRRRKKR